MPTVAEYFLLKESSLAAAKVPEAARREIADTLAEGRQKAEGAQALWSNGHTAEGLRLMTTALHTTLAAARAYEPPEEAPSTSAESADASSHRLTTDSPPDASADDSAAASVAGKTKASASGETHEPTPKTPPNANSRWRRVLGQRGLRPSQIDSIAQADTRAASLEVPALDRDITPKHGDLYVEFSRARVQVERALHPLSLRTIDFLWMRIVRMGSAAAVGLIGLGALIYALNTPTKITATASAVFVGSPNFAPSQVLDNDPQTEWLLPDHETGWLDIHVEPSQYISNVTLVNCDNGPNYYDRATRGYRLEVYSGGALVKTIEGEFPELAHEPAPVVHAIDASSVERIRFVVVSYHNLGGGLADFRIGD